MGRPLHEQKFIIQVRNDIVFQLREHGLSQSDIARVLRLPRNTVSAVIRKGRQPLISTELSSEGRAVYYRESKNARYKNDLQFKLAAVLRSRIQKFLQSSGKSGSVVRDLGCTVSKLKSHIESQFQEGMSWSNWSQNGWHIDHIKPLSSFDLTDRSQFLQACSYKNMRPLWAKENLSKGSKLS